MFVKTKGITLNSFRYTDNKLISHIFTRKLGKTGFLIYVGKSKKSSKKASVFNSLNFVDIEFNHKENTNLQTIKEAGIYYMYHSIPYNDIKRTVALFLAEILSKILHSEAENEELYEFIERSFQYYDLQEEKYSNFHLWFLLQLSKYLGFGLSYSNSPGSNYFDLVEGVFSEFKPIQNKYLEPEIVHYWKELLQTGLTDYHLINIKRDKRIDILNKIVEFYTYRFSELSGLKSLTIMKEIFH